MRYNEATQEVTMSAAQAWALLGCAGFVLRKAKDADTDAVLTIGNCGAAMVEGFRMPGDVDGCMKVGVACGNAFDALANELSGVIDDYAREQTDALRRRLRGEA